MKIFVSSTFQDLGEFRLAVILSLRQLNHEVIAMEEFTAANAPPLDRVLQKVGECDAYVGLFAWSYGYVPDKSSTDIKPKDMPQHAKLGETSITHFEYLQAKSLGKPTLIFLLDEAVPWPPNRIDAFSRAQAAAVAVPARPTVDPDPGKRIRDLRHQLMRERIVSFFSSPSEAGAQAAAAVTNLGMSIGVSTNLVHLATAVSAVSDSHVYGPIRHEIEAASESGRRVSSIDISTQWWATRLYFLAALATEFTSIERIVVVAGTRFVGMLSVATVRSRLEDRISKATAFSKALFGSRAKATDQSEALNIAEREWKKRFPPDKEGATAVHVTEPNLKTWFGDAMLVDAVEVDDLEIATIVDLIRILGYPNDFVPVKGRMPQSKPSDIDRWEGAPVTLIDKRALDHQLANKYIEEQMNRAKIR